MTKAEAKELIIDLAKVASNLNRFDSAYFADSYLNNPNRTIKFDDEISDIDMPKVKIKCNHCGHANHPNRIHCIHCG